jgi:hypothetical protein
MGGMEEGGEGGDGETVLEGTGSSVRGGWQACFSASMREDAREASA